MRTIVAFIFVFLVLVLGTPVLGVLWIVGKFNKPAADLATLRFVQWAFKVILFISGTRLTVKGIENVPKDEAVLYIGNHRSIFDVVVAYSLCPGLTGFIAKNGVNRIPLLRMFMKRLYCLFLDRDDIRQGMKIILSAIEYVKSGISICIFPEGTRNRDKEHPYAMLPFKEGSFKIAQKTGCKIIPMALTGTAEIFENQLPWIKKSEVTLTYGEPICVDTLSAEEKKHLGAYCRQIVASMLPQSADPTENEVSLEE